MVQKNTLYSKAKTQLGGEASRELGLSNGKMMPNESRQDTDTSNTWMRQVMVLMVPWDLTQARFHPGLFHPDVLTAPFPKLSGIVILDRILHPGPSLGGRLIPEDLVSLSSTLVHSV